MYKSVRLSFLTAVFGIAMFSCDMLENKYTVRFDSKGGTPTPQEQTVKEGGKVAKPADPTRDNYTLAGWAKADSETSALWDFGADVVTEDIMLFARWSLNMYAVTFDSNGGSAVPAQNIAHGGRATKPDDPTRTSFEFDGWFVGDTEWNFLTAIIAPVTLKAKWTAVHIVTFDSDGGSAVPPQNVRNGNTATKPATDPTRAGFEFDGWFNGDTEWNFSTAITAPITIKAKWTALHVVTFDSDGGSAVPAQTIRNGGTVTKPADPTKTFTPSAGLYAGSIDPNALLYFTFVEWRKQGESVAFDFNTPITAPITLKAVWNAPPALTRIETVPANDVPAAFTFVNANTSDEYTLLLAANVMVGTQSMNSANAKLTILGIGVERFITVAASDVRLFSIDGSNAKLTIGKNITLVGSSTGYNSPYLIYVQRGNLTMRDGSKITGHTGWAFVSLGTVRVEGINASFKMEGGEISGNAVYDAVVYVSAGATFEMSGGSITGNQGSAKNDNGTEVFINDANCTFLLSGSARIGRLVLYANNNTTRSTITINGNYSGTVTSLHLSGNQYANDVAPLWTNAPVIINGSAAVISMFNNGGLGNFSYNMQFWAGVSIRATHELNAAGVLVLK